MKILYIYSRFFPNIGGIEIQMHNIGKRLIERGHEVTVLTSDLFGNCPGNLPTEEVVDGITIKRFRVLQSNLTRKLVITPSIVRTLLSYDADVIHVFSFVPIFITNIASIISRYRGKPLIATPTYHPYRSKMYSGMTGNLIKIYDELIGLQMLKMADNVIALTKLEAEYYTEKGIKNVSVIPVGVDVAEHTSENEEIEKFRQKFKLDNAYNIILFVGRVERRKGIQFLINSMPSVLKSLPNTKLLFVGNGPDSLEYLRNFEEFEGIQESVILAGRLSQTELSCAYESADVVVVPSLFEAFSHIIIEAWAHKKPVIASNNIGLAEEISSANGELVDYGDHEGLANALIKLLKDQELAKVMGINGYKLIKENFDWENIVDNIEGIYGSVNEGGKV